MKVESRPKNPKKYKIYDFNFIALNEDEVLFCLADVSGKGMSAALLMANFQANLRALVNYELSLLFFVYFMLNLLIL